MRGIEAAFWGVLGNDPELKTSKSGKAFAEMSVFVTVGQDDNGPVYRNGFGSPVLAKLPNDWRIRRRRAIGFMSREL